MSVARLSHDLLAARCLSYTPAKPGGPVLTQSDCVNVFVNALYMHVHTHISMCVQL
jgi:hypothetical protein